MQYRNEWKYEITYPEFLILRSRLSAIFPRDGHAEDGSYEIRSLYFDNIRDKALCEKRDGLNRREKFRLRYYNRDPSFIRLEKKSKLYGMCRKECAVVSAESARALAAGEWEALSPEGPSLLAELYAKALSEGLEPKTIVDYTREPYVYEPGNVRVTLDYHIRTGMGSRAFLDPDSATAPVEGAPMILEVKWDEFLPDLVRDVLQLPGQRQTAFSKYAAARVYG